MLSESAMNTIAFLIGNWSVRVKCNVAKVGVVAFLLSQLTSLELLSENRARANRKILKPFVLT